MQCKMQAPKKNGCKLDKEPLHRFQFDRRGVDKFIVYKSSGEHFFWIKFEIWAGFGPARKFRVYDILVSFE